MPWKQWAYLEKLPSADFQTYLQNQVIAQFTSTAQRDAQWSTPARGSRCITTDTNTTWLYDGTQWLPMPGTVRGIIAAGSQVNQPGTNTLLPVNSVLAGASSWLNTGTGTITIPAGAGGLYLIQADMWYRSDNVALCNAEIVNTAGASFAPQEMMIGGITYASTGTQRVNSSWLRPCADNDTFKILYRGNPVASPGWFTIKRFSFVRIGDSLPGLFTLEAPLDNTPPPENPDAK